MTDESTPTADQPILKTEEKVNTDSTENRIKRGENQYLFEQEMILHTHNKPVQDRYTAVRTGVLANFGN